jgi:hypothetical protein
VKGRIAFRTVEALVRANDWGSVAELLREDPRAAEYKIVVECESEKY